MKVTTKAGLCLLIAVAMSAGAVFAGAEGRLSITVKDASGKPLDEAKIVLTNPASGAEDDKLTNKKGKAVFLVLDATLTYGIRISKEGFQPMQDQVRPQVGTTLRLDWELAKATGAVPGGATTGAEVKGSPAAIRLYNAGAEANNQGDRAMAVEKFRAAVEADAGFTPGYQALLGLYLQAGDWANVLATADAMLEVAPSDVMALGARYDALGELGRSDEANAVLDTMVASLPGPATARRLYNRAANKLKDPTISEEEKFAAAIPDLERAVGMDAELTAARSALTMVYLSKKDFGPAAENALVLRDADPEDAGALSLLYDAYVGLGETDKAKLIFAELQKISPEKAAEAFYNQGVAQLDRGKAQDALASFEKVLASNPGHVRVHYMLGLAYLNTSKLDLAKSSLNKFLELAPDDPRAGDARQMLAALE